MAKNKTGAHSTVNWTPVVAVEASGPGALRGYEATCLHCSHTYGSSIVVVKGRIDPGEIRTIRVQEGDR